jgi:hypothetical protein
VTTRQFLTRITERQISDDTRLRRVVALFQRELGRVFNNASVRRRNRRYEIDFAVYEQPLPGGRPFQMPDRQINEWIRQAALKAHPRLYKRLTVNIDRWRSGHASKKLFAPVKIFIDASQSDAGE